MAAARPEKSAIELFSLGVNPVAQDKRFFPAIGRGELRISLRHDSTQAIQPKEVVFPEKICIRGI